MFYSPGPGVNCKKFTAIILLWAKKLEYWTLEAYIA
jgi:hypothetical protein